MDTHVIGHRCGAPLRCVAGSVRRAL